MLDVFSIALTFAATIVGILGKTWDRDAKGFGKLTITGRVAAILAILALLVACLQILAKRKIERTRRQVAQIGYETLEVAIHESFLLPLAQLSRELNPSREFNAKRYHEDWDYAESYLRDALGTNEKIDLEKLKLTDSPTNDLALHHVDKQWWEVLATDFRNGRDEFDRTAALFGPYMDPEVLWMSADIARLQSIDAITEYIPDMATNAGSPDVPSASDVSAWLVGTTTSEKPDFLDRIGELKKAISKRDTRTGRPAS